MQKKESFWWLLTWTATAVIVLASYLLAALAFHHWKGVPLRLTDSIAYDAKLNFLRENRQQLAKSKTLVIGSSMALNNIDGATLDKEGSLTPIMNVGSWGLKPSDCEALLKVLSPNSLEFVIYPIQYFDLASKIEVDIPSSATKRYLSSGARLQDVWRTANTIRHNLADHWRWQAIHNDNRDSRYLGFSRYGDALFSSTDFNVEMPRWNLIPATETSTFHQYKHLSSINQLVTNAGGKLVVVRPPFRQNLLLSATKEQKQTFDKHLEALQEAAKTNGFILIDSHERLRLTDEYFIDSSHLNSVGAQILSTDIVSALRLQGLLTAQH